MAEKDEHLSKFQDELNWKPVHGYENFQSESNFHRLSKSSSSSKEFLKENSSKMKYNWPFILRCSSARTSNYTQKKRKSIVRKSKLKRVVGNILDDRKSAKFHDNEKSDHISKNKCKLDKQVHSKFGSFKPKDMSKCNPCMISNKSGCFMPKGPESVLTQNFSSLNIKESKAINDCNDLQVSLPLNWEERRLTKANSFQEDEECDTSSLDTVLPDFHSLSISEIALGCASQARSQEDVSTDELAAYLDNYLYLPKKMSFLAEMMYT